MAFISFPEGLHAVNHTDLAETYILMNEVEKAKDYYRSGFKINPSLIELFYPTMAKAYKSTPFIDELEGRFNSIDQSQIPQSISVQLRASFAVGKNDLVSANRYVGELEKLAQQGLFSYAYLFDFYNILGNEDKAAYWATKAVQEKDGLLTYQSTVVLPEQCISERVAKILTSPKLDKLYEIRRKNLGLAKTSL